ncbi:bifunctional folylpolyglutamate synthase/dihydrofolate synthase [Synechococcus sp. CS-1324]|uniref:bifunctional folylpolyglutamate synthase/dihydrofolate synthase n=1 Tax=Synechococcus sp. CS-1324 TaxID=2847980 RepID=UPI000DB6C8BC|nr:Mur ligase family protein [Synechococcus sp. CS-1324]MCT0231494.1 bifunctional folylpolyglutamate synthase/dihydrofolate synthase [Synechococcus sp. CS-1324]PZV03913.1 MAG: bifunctional folylpolyglutamate synthase/dihydrofolate synthase [Cyanobium sp.]
MAPPADSFADLIEPFSRRGIDLGLERLSAALAELGHPERRFAAVQVAGTNGKGSVCTLLHAALSAAGLRCGLYTSPHLVSWCERIRLGPDLISPARLRALLSELQPLARRHDLTPFELITAAAFQAFAAANLEIVVLEVGLGGRLDATTVHPGRQVVGFTPIGMDHAEYLGSSLGLIAAEKAGVLIKGGTAVSGPQHPEVALALERRAVALGCRLHWVDPLETCGEAFVAGALHWRSGLPGQVQRCNSAVALGMLRLLRQGGWTIPDQAITAGFAAARWPARLQPSSWRGHPLLLDGAHNVPAAKALRSELDHRSAGQQADRRPWCFVVGMLANKQGPELLAALLAPGDRAWLVPVPGHACWSRDDLLAASPSLGDQLDAAGDPSTALAAAIAASPGDQPVVVAGSLYLLGSFLSIAEGE